LPAFFEHRPYRRKIAWLNVLLGWTVVGWIISLVWALSENGVVLRRPAARTKPSGYVAEKSETASVSSQRK
jgi:hypothetical protein